MKKDNILKKFEKFLDKYEGEFTEILCWVQEEKRNNEKICRFHEVGVIDK